VYLAQGRYSDAQTNFERALELREKAQAPQEVADTRHNLGDTFTRMGQYDKALQQYMAALDLRRKSGDKRNAALASYGIGTIFDYQGKYGSATKSKEEAVRAFRELNQQDVWLAELLSGYGSSLSLSGRPADAQTPLEQALKLATDLKNVNLIAQTLRFQANRLYYAGDVTGALAMSKQVTQATSSSTDRSLVLQTQAETTMMSAASDPSRAIAARLAALSQEADTRGLKSLSVECSVRRAEMLLALGDRNEALREADRAIGRADILGLKVPLARAHYVKGAVLQANADPGARREFTLAVRAFEDVKRDGGNERVLERADLAGVYAAAVKGAGS
jgi:tetratricopeptide (TPR) repeat protein